jgi:hypothetical protein
MAIAIVVLFLGCLTFLKINQVYADPGYTFIAPGDIVLGEMVPSVDPYTGNSSGSLTGDNPAGYTVTASDNKTENKGYMVSGTSVLHSKFNIGASAGSVASSDVERTLLTTSAPGTDSVPLFVSQEISYNDAVVNGYSITITYTVVPR